MGCSRQLLSPQKRITGRWHGNQRGNPGSQSVPVWSSSPTLLPRHCGSSCRAGGEERQTESEQSLPSGREATGSQVEAESSGHFLHQPLTDWVYSFPVAAITICYELSCLRQHNFPYFLLIYMNCVYSYSFGHQKPEVDLTGSSQK